MPTTDTSEKGLESLIVPDEMEDLEEASGSDEMEKEENNAE